jgi:hypothetical protein
MCIESDLTSFDNANGGPGAYTVRTMQPDSYSLTLASLETVDRVARAAHLWVRHGRAVRELSPGSGSTARRHELAAGVISGLCDALALNGDDALLAAYVYALLAGEDDEALATATAVYRQRAEPSEHFAFIEGQSAAGDLLAILRSPQVEIDEPGFGTA